MLRRRPSRAVLAVALVTLVAALVAGCNSGSAWIARIDGKAIDSPNFWEGVPYFTQYASALNQTAPPTTVVEGVSDTSLAGTYAAFLVQLDVLKRLNAKRNITVTDAEVNTARQAYAQAPFDKFPSWFVTQLAEAQANFQALQAYYGKGTDANKAVQDYYDQNKEQFRQACIDVIPATDESELTEARRRIEEGAEFSTVAKAVAESQPAAADGTKAQPEGDKHDGYLGCWGTSDLSRLFATPAELAKVTDAKPNTLVGPLPIAGGGFALFNVRSVGYQALEDVRSTIESAVGQPGQQEAMNAMTNFLTKAHVQLNPRVGTWNSDVRTWSVLGPILPPAGADQPAGQTATSLDLSGLTG